MLYVAVVIVVSPYDAIVELKVEHCGKLGCIRGNAELTPGMRN